MQIFITLRETGLQGTSVACVREHKCESFVSHRMYIDITIGNVFPVPTILCVILSNREDPLHMYVCMYLKVRLSGPA